MSDPSVTSNEDISNTTSTTPSATTVPASPVSPNTLISPGNRALQASLVSDLRQSRKLSSANQIDNKWIDVQEKTFYRWVNYHLSKRNLSIENLKNGFSDGIVLVALIEILNKQQGLRLAKPKIPAKNQVVKLDNLSISFQYLAQQKGMHLVNIRPGDIEQGNLKIILGLVWGLIMKYQIIDGATKTSAGSPQKERASSVSAASTASTNASTNTNASVVSDVTIESNQSTPSNANTETNNNAATGTNNSSSSSSSSSNSAAPSENTARGDLLQWVSSHKHLRSRRAITSFCLCC